MYLRCQSIAFFFSSIHKSTHIPPGVIISGFSPHKTFFAGGRNYLPISKAQLDFEQFRFVAFFLLEVIEALWGRYAAVPSFVFELKDVPILEIEGLLFGLQHTISLLIIAEEGCAGVVVELSCMLGANDLRAIEWGGN